MNYFIREGRAKRVDFFFSTLDSELNSVDLETRAIVLC